MFNWMTAKQLSFHTIEGAQGRSTRDSPPAVLMNWCHMSFRALVAVTMHFHFSQLVIPECKKTVWARVWLQSDQFY